MPVPLEDVASVAATSVGAPDVGAGVLAQLARQEPALIHVLRIPHCVGAFIRGADGEGLVGELAVRDWKERSEQ